MCPEKIFRPFTVSAAGALLSGVLLYLSFPPVDLYLLSFVALVPLFIVLLLSPSAARACLYAGIGGAVFFLPALVWLASVTVAGWILLALYMTLYFCLFGVAAYLYSGLKRFESLFFIPVLWVALEFVRANVFTGFPWLLYGHTQYRFRSLLQLASVTGVYGLSFLLVLINIAIAALIVAYIRARRRGDSVGSDHLKRHYAVIAAALFFLVSAAVFGSFSLRRLQIVEGPVFGVVQQNVPPELLPPDDILQIYRRWEEEQSISEKDRARVREYKDERVLEQIKKAARLSRKLAAAEPVLIAWPETTVSVPINPNVSDYLYPSEWRHRRYALDTIGAVAEETGSYLLVGAPALQPDRGERRTYNSAFLFSPEGEVLDRYDKIHLVPFGEYTPARNLLPDAIANLLMSLAIAQSTPGEEPVVFTEPLEFAAPICYDNVFSPLMRHFRREGARVLVNISNEGWYHIRGELEQHLAMAVFRAVETRTSVVRATNTGISCFIDPSGQIYGTVSRVEDGQKRMKNVEGSLALPVRLTDQVPLYTRFGDWFAGLCAAATAVGMLLLLIRRIRLKLFQKRT